MASTGGLVASPVTVLSAIAFQSVITVGSSAAIVAAVAAVAVPVAARVASRIEAATAATQIRRCALRRRVGGEESGTNARIVHPRAAWSP
jgi:hypothetical protein